MELIDHDILLFCAAECERQQSGEMSVANMAFAWNFAGKCAIDGTAVSPMFVQMLARFIEPGKNLDGYRKVPVSFRDGSLAIPYDQVSSAIRNLCDGIKQGMTPEEAYQEFEAIHPFVDGNGRVGSILFNYLNKTMLRPVRPPEFKK